MGRAERAWAAGFFDAEGWAGAARSRAGVRPLARIDQAGAGAVPEVLLRFQVAVGGGRVRGPVRMAGRRELYRWEASSRGDVARTFDALRPWLGVLKTRQFAAALGLAEEDGGVRDTREELPWAAGLFDGDGSVSLLRHRTHAGYLLPELTITQASRAGVPEVLERFQSALGAGRSYGPYPGGPGHAAIYRLRVHRTAPIEATLRSIRPWLGTVKRVQVDEVLAVMASQVPLPRGNPAWGRDKSHCVHGHELAIARVRPYRPRKASVTTRRKAGHRGCLECLRLRARRARAAEGGPPTC